jgi:transcriptional regulator with PAS, ATPase and Fis domain
MGKETEHHRLSEAAQAVFARLNLLGQSPAFHDALNVIERIADVDATVLIQGETGTGKELAARALHYLSHRRDHPFIPVNCGALPDSLLESELFGYERGAFTDAKKGNSGLIMQAKGGTLLLDEIEAMTPRAQVVLLRFLQDHHYRPIGGRLVSDSDVRIVASSNVDLEQLARRGQFRQDLLFRFSVLSVTMPPMRQRGHDAVLLAEYFLNRFSAEYDRPAKPLHPDAASWLLTHDWPGNVRELENMMLRLFLLTDGNNIRIEPTTATASLNHVAGDVNSTQTFRSAKANAIAQFELAYLTDLLARTSGNISLAARISRKDRSALNKLVKKHGLAAEEFRTSAA